MSYFPPPHPADWATIAPGTAGLDAEAIAAAARDACECETPWERDLAVMVTGDFQECPPWNETLGPVRPRGAPNGLVLRGGRIVAEWGDTMRADMTLSVGKSYLAILAGLAWDHGLIGDPDEPVCATVEDGGFTRRTTTRSPGIICSSKPRNGRACCGRSRISSTATVASPEGRAWRRREPTAISIRRAGSGNTTMSE